MGVTWVNKITWISTVKFHHTSSVCCIVSPPKVKPFSISIYLTLFYLPIPFPSGNHHGTVCVYKFSIFLCVLCCFQLYIPLTNEIV